MKILLTHRYFYPDTPPYAQMLRTIGDRLAAEGNAVEVFSSRPSYRAAQSAPAHETLGALRVRRCWVFPERGAMALRVINMVIYCIWLTVHILRTRPDIVTAASFPPVLAARAASFAAGIAGAKFIYHLQDIHPEVSEQSGGIMGRSPIAGVFRWLDNQTLRAAAGIIVLSPDMADTIRARSCGDLPIHVINNFELEQFETSEPPAEYRKPAGATRVIFAGNLGRFQNLPLLADGIATRFNARPDLELVFLGDGVAQDGLKARWGDHPQVRFIPFLPYPQARELIAEADVGLVSLLPGLYRIAYPQKLQTYLGLGVPALALIERESRMAEIIETHGLGAVPTAATPDAIGDALDKVLDAPDRTAAIEVFYLANATRQASLDKWVALTEALKQSEPQ